MKIHIPLVLTLMAITLPLNNGYASWEILQLPTDRGFTEIWATDEQHIFVGGHEGLWKTFDSENWTLDSMGNSPGFVYFVDDTLGFTMGFNWTSALHRTTDGGKTWNVVKDGNGDTTFAQEVTFPRNQSTLGYLFGWDRLDPYKSSIYKTTDGGTNWEKQPPLPDVYPSSQESISPSDICFPDDPDTGYLAATCIKHLSEGEIEYHSSYFKTTDGGQTWVLNEEGLWNDDFGVGHIAFPENATVGYMAGGGGKVFKTTNGGVTWDTVFRTPEGYPNIYDICFPVTDQVGYVLNDTMIHKTTDGGETWRTFGLGMDTVFLRCHFLNDSLGFISGTGTTAYNLLYTPGFVMKTTDGLLGITEEDWDDVGPAIIEVSTSLVFTDELVVSYSSREPGRLRASLYDAAGREVRSLGLLSVNPGQGSLSFNGANLPSGVYFVRVEFSSAEGNQSKTIKAVKVR